MRSRCCWPPNPTPGTSDQRAASGGELSRIMLALQVVLAAPTGAHPTVREVDAGVGGRAPVEVGRRLARLARNAQVIVGDPPTPGGRLRRPPCPGGTHGRGHTVTPAWTTPGALRELSRMLAGQEDSVAARRAEELSRSAVAYCGITRRPEGCTNGTSVTG